MEMQSTGREGDAAHRPPEAPSAFAIGHRIERVSEPMRIRGYDWRLVLYWGRGCGFDEDGRLMETTTLLVGYEWRCAGAWGGRMPWQRDVDWPRYDSHNGETAGLPRTLRKLWERCPWAHKEAIARRMAGEEEGEA